MNFSKPNLKRSNTFSPGGGTGVKAMLLKWCQVNIYMIKYSKFLSNICKLSTIYIRSKMINFDGILNPGNYLIGPGDSLKNLIYGPIKLVRNYILLSEIPSH